MFCQIAPKRTHADTKVFFLLVYMCGDIPCFRKCMYATSIHEREPIQIHLQKYGRKKFTCTVKLKVKNEFVIYEFGELSSFVSKCAKKILFP